MWAMDFTQLDAPIDGCFSHALVVRDLASGYLLMALAARSGRRAEPSWSPRSRTSSRSTGPRWCSRGTTARPEQSLYGHRAARTCQRPRSTCSCDARRWALAGDETRTLDPQLGKLMLYH